MTLPARIKVGWRMYRVESWSPREASGARRLGEACHTAEIIRVDETMGERQAAETLLHEILHAVANIFELDDKDDQERTISILSSGLATVITDNPGLLSWLSERLPLLPERPAGPQPEREAGGEDRRHP